MDNKTITEAVAALNEAGHANLAKELIQATSPEQWEYAAELIEDIDGLQKWLENEMEAVVRKGEKAQKRQANMSRMGVGRTEAPTLLKPVLQQLKKMGDDLEDFAERAAEKIGEKL